MELYLLTLIVGDTKRTIVFTTEFLRTLILDRLSKQEYDTIDIETKSFRTVNQGHKFMEDSELQYAVNCPDIRALIGFETI